MILVSGKEPKTIQNGLLLINHNIHVLVMQIECSPNGKEVVLFIVSIPQI
jgi:hypothetical protein